MLKKKFKDKHYQTLEQVAEHYEIEKELASRLRNSTQQERVTLYSDIYDELYRRLPNNSIAIRKLDSKAALWVAAQRLQLLSHFLKPDVSFVEIGPGDCSLCFEVSKRVKQVYAVDVTESFKDDVTLPNNFKLIISDGSSISLPENSVDVVYSHQVMEHLHPDDAVIQLQNICRILAPGGVYICITPNRLSGPHDVSHHFDEVATGLHLKEYTVTELYRLFQAAGFSKTHYYKSSRSTHAALPLNAVTVGGFKVIEGSLQRLPYSLRRSVASLPLLFRGMTIVGTK